jgi:tetratricopeptide (TPR) repeat protein
VDTDKWLERGNAALAGKRWDEAQEAFVQALEVEPTSMPAWQGLWKSVRLRLDVETAEQLAGAIRAVEADAASATAWHDLGTALLGWHNTEAAIAFRQQAVLDPGDESGYSGLGLALSDERPDEALETVTRALELEPSASNWAQRSEVLSNLHRFEEAEAAATKALELEPLPYVSEWIALAVPLWCLDRKEEAAEAHLRATRIDPYDAYSFFRQAIESTGRSDDEAVEETIDSLTAVTMRYPDDTSAWECLTRALANNTWAGDAIAAGRRATQVDPKSASAWLALGEALYLLGDEAETVDAFNRAVELDPGNCWAWDGLADALADVGQFDEARAARVRAKELLAQ